MGERGLCRSHRWRYDLREKEKDFGRGEGERQDLEARMMSREERKKDFVVHTDMAV